MESPATMPPVLSALHRAQLNDSNRIISAISFAILYYDYVLTLPVEVEQYWKAPKSWGAFLFYANRYLAILSHIPIIYEYFGDTSETLIPAILVELYHGILMAVAQGTNAVLLILRTYALYDCNRKVAWALGSILVVGGSVSIWSFNNTSLALQYNPGGSPLETRLLDSGCIIVLSPKESNQYALAWGSILIFDFAVFVLTLARALRLGMALRRGLFYVILRDGSAYFGILVMCYLSNVLTFVFAPAGYQGYLTTLTNVLSSTLVSRMMLNIRDHRDARARYELPYSQLSGIGDDYELQFRRAPNSFVVENTTIP